MLRAGGFWLTLNHFRARRRLTPRSNRALLDLIVRDLELIMTKYSAKADLGQITFHRNWLICALSLARLGPNLAQTYKLRLAQIGNSRPILGSCD